MGEIETIKEKKEKSKGDKLIIMDSPEFKQRVFELREEDDTLSWSEVTKKVNGEFGLTMTSKAIENLYQSQLATEIEVKGYADKQFTNYIASMAKRYETLMTITDRVMRAVDTLTSTLEEASETDIEGLLLIMKQIKPLKDLSNMVLAQLEFVREEQNKISLKMSNNKDMSDEDIKKKLYKFLPEVLKVYEMQGKIKINDKSVLN